MKTDANTMYIYHYSATLSVGRNIKHTDGIIEWCRPIKCSDDLQELRDDLSLDLGVDAKLITILSLTPLSQPTDYNL